MLRRCLVSALFTLGCVTMPAAEISGQRDTPQLPAATALIVGRTVDSNNGPIAGVLVTLNVRPTQQDILIERRALTNAEGEFLFAGLPGGECVIRTEKGGYAAEDADGRYLSPESRFFSLGNGHRRTNVVLVLMKHASISGSVTDDAGAPIRFSTVTVLRRTIEEGRPRFVSARGTMGLADDRGRYQVSGLIPGKYVVTARTSSKLKISVDGERGEETRHLAYPVAIFPAPGPDGSATFVDISAGQALSDIDFRLAPAPAARVTGVVRGAGNVTRTLVELIADVSDDVSRITAVGPSFYVQAEGTFVFDAVPAGSYTLRALKRTERVPNSTAEPVGWASWATVRLTMTGRDIDDVPLMLQPAVRVSGRVETDDGSSAADLIRRAYHRIDIKPLDDRQPHSGQALQIADDGRFIAVGFIPGRYMIHDSGGQGVRLKSAALNGRDISTTSFEIGTRGIDGLVLTITRSPQ